jgi:voltage-gated potassium channel
MGLGLFALPVGIIASAFVTEIHRRDFVVTSSMLSRIPLFSGLDIEVMGELMAVLRSHMVAPHTPIVVAGESPTAMYFLVSGLAKVATAGRGRGAVGTLGPGDMIAAEAVLNGTSHEATIFAHTPVRLLALSNQDLVILLRKFPRLRRRIQKSSIQSNRKFKKRPLPEEPAFSVEEEDDEMRTQLLEPDTR